MMRFVLVAVCMFLPGCAGCGQTRAEYMKDQEKNLLRRAAFDLGCPEAELRVVDLGDATRGVEGCERKSTYLLDRRTETWLVNGAAGSTPAAAPSALDAAAPPPSGAIAL